MSTFRCSSRRARWLNPSAEARLAGLVIDVTKAVSLAYRSQMRSWVGLLALLVTTSASASPKDEEMIMKVSQRFHETLAAKDKEAFLSLFVSPLAPCLGPFERWTEEALLPQTAESMITSLSRKRGRIEEPARNQRIEIADGVIASMTFDYEYLEDGKRINSGREFWHLVYVDGAWKISSIVFSVRVPRSKRSPVQIPVGATKRYAGTYAHAWGPIHVKSDEQRIWVRMSWEKEATPWYPSSSTTFYRKALPWELRFEKDAAILKVEGKPTQPALRER